MKGTARLIPIVMIAMLVATGSAQAAETTPPATAPAAPPAGVTAEAAPAEPAIVAAPVDAQALKDAIRVQGVEVREQINDAKERDYLAKMRLHTFNEEVLKNLEPPGGARLTVTHRNELASGYTLTGVAYALDGAQIYAKLDLSGALDERGQIPILDAKVIPGEHQLVVQYDVKGNGWGFFSYLNDMRVQLRRSYNFKVDQGKETRLVGTVGTSDGFGELYENRPFIGFQTLSVDLPKPKGPAVVASADASDSATKAEGTAPPLPGELTGADLQAPPPPPAAGK